VWGWKIAYDESFARFSPGVQVLVDLTERLLKMRPSRAPIPAATPDHPMIDHIWREGASCSPTASFGSGPTRRRPSRSPARSKPASRGDRSAKRLRDLLRR